MTKSLEKSPRSKSRKKAVEPVEKAQEVLSSTVGSTDKEISDSIPVVIPYLKSEAAGDELKYALRAWEKNFHHPFHVVVVGDKEDWFSEHITHVPHSTHSILEDCGCDDPKKIRNPQADVAHKLLTVIASKEVNGDFILTNDDIFILGEQGLSHISQPRYFGSLEDFNGKNGGTYRENALRTAKLLKANGKPTLRFGTHTPVLLNSELLAEVLKEYHCVEQGTLVTSLYFNHHHPDERGLVQVTGGKNCFTLASVYRTNPDPEILKQALSRRLYINCNSNGWKALRPIFEKSFPEKSIFEK